MPLKAHHRFQTVSLAIAYLCYLAALLCLVGGVYRASIHGTDDPVFASLMASVIFFIGCGIVLHVIGSVNLPKLSIQRKAKD